jgi:uroporphyrinogen-III synthase
MRLLVTRPEPDNARTAEALREQGHAVLLAPLLRIEPIANADIGAPPWAAVLLSSANGARTVMGHPRRGEITALPALVVGRSSAEAAREAGFANVISADGDASHLSRLAVERLAGVRAPLLYLAGEDRSGNLSGALAEKGLTVRTVVAYRAAKMERFPAEAHAALAHGRIDGVLHFSRRSVEAYIACGRRIEAQAFAPVHYCLSARAAEPLKHAGAARIEVAAQPNETALLALVPRNVMPKP